MQIWKATKYLKDIASQKQSVPSHRYTGGDGRCARGKQWGCTQGLWPMKIAELSLPVLKNAKSHDELKGFDVSSLGTEHTQVSQVPQDVMKNLQGRWLD